MLSITPRRRWNPAGFISSLLIHAAIGGVIVLAPPSQLRARPPQNLLQDKYSVLVVHLDPWRPQLKDPPLKTQGAPASKGSGSQASSQGARSAALNDPLERLPDRPGRLTPPVSSRPPAKQTLIQADVPPDIQLKQTIPLPAIAIWERMPVIHKTFVAPARAEKPRTIEDIPTAPVISRPNDEPLIGELKLANALPRRQPKIFRPPAKTMPIRSETPVQVAEAPQIARSDSEDTNLAALVSIPRNAVASAGAVVIPPANQIASDTSGGGAASSGAGHSAQPGIGRAGSSGKGSVSGPEGGAGNSDTSNGTAIAGLANANGGRGVNGSRSGNNATTGTGATAGTGAVAGTDTTAGTGTASGTGAESAGLPRLPAGATLVSLPKDGKFGVVVTGSSLAAPYAETIGALTGRMIYSVYINVGLRKKWILQYCLLKADEQSSTSRGSAAPRLDAPWPYNIVRPDDLGNSSGEYLIVHGILNTDGHLDKLSLVYPNELAKKDLLVSSLKQWAFRPASRDGAFHDVEILIIIPSQSE